WKTYRFDQIAISVAYRVEPSETELEHYVGLEHLDGESLKIRRWGSPSDVIGQKLGFRKGDIIFGKRRAYQRKLAVADFDGICSAHAMVLRPNADVVLPEFLPFFMQSDLFMNRALKISVGSLSPTINWRTLAQQEFPLPPLDEQRRIVKLLLSSLEMTEASSELSEASENLLWAFAKQTFNQHKEIYPLLTVPKLTQRLTVGIVVKPADWYVSDGEGVPALRSLNVLPGKLQLADLIHISQEGHEVHHKSQLTAGDIVVVRSGRPGDATVIPENFGPLNCIDLVIATPTDAILPDYFVAYLNSPPGRREFTAGMAGTAQQHFNVSAF
ncbi:MAG: restriction endonuclease subunit S, partial [Chloroflexi bacterium]|nr:restriction endonuclease subunit S [Chloroflexota bacterium]